MCEFEGSKNDRMPDNRLYAGFAKVNITPDYPCGLHGYGNVSKRLHEAVLEPIFATCIALTAI